MTAAMMRTRTMVKMKMTAKPSSNDSKSSSSDDQPNDGATERLISWGEYFCLCFCFYALFRVLFLVLLYYFHSLYFLLYQLSCFKLCMFCFAFHIFAKFSTWLPSGCEGRRDPELCTGPWYTWDHDDVPGIMVSNDNDTSWHYPRPDVPGILGFQFLTLNGCLCLQIRSLASEDWKSPQALGPHSRSPPLWNFWWPEKSLIIVFVMKC